jgi:hypothetical protein
MIPPPSHVAQVWLLTDETLAVHFPCEGPHGHTIHLSGDVYGLTCLLQVLRERQKEGPYTVGRESTPTQWQIDRAIRKIKLTTGEEAPPKLDVRRLSRADREALRGQQEVERRKAKRERENFALLEELGLL